MRESTAAIFCDIGMSNMGRAKRLAVLVDDSRRSFVGIWRIPQVRDGCRKADESVAAELLKLADHTMDRARRALRFTIDGLQPERGRKVCAKHQYNSQDRPSDDPSHLSEGHEQSRFRRLGHRGRMPAQTKQKRKTESHFEEFHVGLCSTAAVKGPRLPRFCRPAAEGAAGTGPWLSAYEYCITPSSTLP
jgi:hypothetical protein